MSLAKILQIDTSSMSHEELLTMEFAERRWHEVGRPTTRWGLIALLRSVINDVLDSLIECPSILLERLKPWRDMVALGLTTWAEQPEPTRSDSHAWSAHPNFDFLTIVAGIRPKTPGFASVSIEPHLGGLGKVVSAVPTPKGVVEVNYVTSTSGVSAEINLPPDVGGDFVWKGKTLSLHPGHQQFLLP